LDRDHSHGHGALVHGLGGVIRLSIPADVSAPVVAREALNALDASLGAQLLEDSGLVVTEVVTNCVRHAGLAGSQQIDLKLSSFPRFLRIEVSDDGPGFIGEPASSKPDQAPGGWGLWLVDQLTDRWGVDCSQRTHVWLEFDRTAPSGSA
jgi:anti-sigma regulatory factor (Ser/Thr protein kinase)